MVSIVNEHGIDLPLAVWLLQDGYKSGAENAPEGELISATTLMKPTRQLLLKRKVDMKKQTSDISEYIAQRMGHALHDSIERAWTEGNWKRAMSQLGYTNEIINKVKINPRLGSCNPDDIPIYLEYRGFKPFEDVVITGQLDFVINHSYRDFKSTSTFSYTSGSKDDDYIVQGSIYRWIMPNLIKNDVMRIEFIFTDWQSYRAKADKNYPQKRVTHKEYTLMSLEDTEKWVSNKLAEIRSNAGKSQSTMVRCTDKELWKQKDSYKYFNSIETANKGGRCSKRFKSRADAELHMSERLGKGTIQVERGKVKACEYCAAFPVCEQRKEYFTDQGTPL
jgi:hypothetical protein